MALSFTKKNSNNIRNTNNKSEKSIMVAGFEQKNSTETESKFEHSSAGISSTFFIPEMEKLEKILQAKLNTVLKRAALATSLDDEDIKTRVSIKTEENEPFHLRNFLLLSCINQLGEMFKGESSISFLNWLDSNNSSLARNTREDIVNKAIGSLGIIDDESKATKLIKSVFAQYRINSQSESNFNYFLKEGLSLEMQYKISDNCWIYQDNPLERWANLHNVREGYSNVSTQENKRLSNARKRWDVLEHSQKLQEISAFIELLFNQYTLCVVPPDEKPEKDPIAKIWRDIMDSIKEYRINYLSNSLFNLLGAEGEKFKFNEVRCVYKDNELYIHENEVRDKDRDVWLHRLAEWLKSKTESGDSPGETVFIPSRNQALVIGGNSFSLTLEEWIESSVRNIIEKGAV